MAFDEAAPLQFAEQIERAIGEAVAVAIPAIDLHDAVVSPDVLNAAALREAVQHALLQFRDVQERRLSSH